MIYNGNDYLQLSVQFQVSNNCQLSLLLFNNVLDLCMPRSDVLSGCTPDLGIFRPRFSGQFGLPTNCGARIRTKFILSRFVETQGQDVFWNLWHYFWWRHEVRYDGW